MEPADAEVSLYLNSYQLKSHVSVLHEGRLDSHKIRKLIKWGNDEKNLFEWLEFLLSLDGNKFVGDTGMYYLPYIEQIIE